MKNDFLRECMAEVGILPINEFTQAYCLRCVNQECSRSAGNQHLFVQRAENWKKRLFTEVIRANENDPQFAEVRSKLFVPKQPHLGSINMPTIQPEPTEIINRSKPEPEPEPIEEAILEESLLEIPIESSPKSMNPKITPAPNIGIQNTPFQQGTMLGDAPINIIPAGGTVFFEDE